MSGKVGRPPKYNTKEEMQEQIDAYFKSCEEDKKPLTVVGLALALDMTRETLIQYSKSEEFSDTIKKAKMKVEEQLEMMLFGNSVTGVIFNLKNNFGWADKQEVKHSGDSDAPPVWTVNIKKADDGQK